MADANGGLIESTVVAERLSDIAKGLVIAVRLIETARIDLVCAAFKVPTSAAKPERGISLMGSSFARTVARLRQDKKVLVGDDASTSGAAPRQPLRPHNRQQDRQGLRRTAWKCKSDGAPGWGHQSTGNAQTAGSNAGPRAGGSNAPAPQGNDFRSLTHAYDAWCALTSDSWVLRAVDGYRIKFLSLPTQRSTPPPIPYSGSEIALIDDLVTELLAKRAI